MKAKLRHCKDGAQEYDMLWFWCPGCDEHHAVKVNMPDGSGWGWNGSEESPTISPSVLVRSGHYVPGHKGDACWCAYNVAHPDNPSRFKCSVCHSFVANGKIQFLNDSTHALAGQTVELQDMDEEGL